MAGERGEAAPPPPAPLALNVNVLTRLAAAGGAAGSDAELAADEAAVWDVAHHLQRVVIPGLFRICGATRGYLWMAKRSRACATRGASTCAT